MSDLATDENILLLRGGLAVLAGLQLVLNRESGGMPKGYFGPNADPTNATTTFAFGHALTSLGVTNIVVGLSSGNKELKKNTLLVNAASLATAATSTLLAVRKGKVDQKSGRIHAFMDVVMAFACVAQALRKKRSIL